MIARCPTCQNSVKVSPALVGRPFICPECKGVFTVTPPRLCPKCGQELAPDEVLCVRCGFHLERGETIAEAHVAPPPPEEKPPVYVRFLVNLYDLAPGLFRPLNVGMFLVCVAIAVGVALLALMMLGFGLFFETLYIGSLAMVIHAQGSAFLFLPKLQGLKSAFIDMEGDSWWAYLTVVFMPAVILVVIMFLAARHLPAG